MAEAGKLGLWDAVAIGIGGMVGGGIFAVLGLAVETARGGTPVAFLVAGLVALATAYSYSRLSVTFPGPGGTVEFINQAFGAGTLTGGLNMLLWLSYVVMLALYAHAFGSYGATFFDSAHQALAKHGLITAIAILLTVLNLSGARAVGMAEQWIVGFKLVILVVFVVAGFATVDPQRLALSHWSSPTELVAGGMLIFLAYEGFELIANTSGDVRNPQRNLPRAYFISVITVIVLYILVSTVTVGSLPLDKIQAARDYALAESARPALGQAGFLLITVAALLSTSSAINATLYGAARVSYMLAKDGELPEVFEEKIWRRPVGGLLLTAALSILTANLFDLERISLLGSAGFLLVFAAVNAANLRLRAKTASRAWIAATGTLACIAALVTLIYHALQTAASGVMVLGVGVVAAFTAEFVYRRATGRVIRSHCRTP